MARNVAPAGRAGQRVSRRGSADASGARRSCARGRRRAPRAAPIRSGGAASRSRATGGRSPPRVSRSPRTSGSTPVPDRAHRRRDDVDHAVRLASAGVEGLAARLAAVERVGEREVGVDRVVDVQEVALRRAVGADHRRLAAQRATSTTGRHEARAVLVAAAVDVAEASRGDRQPVGRPVRAGDDVRRGLGGLVGPRRAQRRALGERQSLGRSVCVLGRGDRPPRAPLARSASSSVQVPRTLDSKVSSGALSPSPTVDVPARWNTPSARHAPQRRAPAAPPSTTSPSTTSHSRSSRSSASTQPGRARAAQHGHPGAALEQRPGRASRRRTRRRR